MTDSIEQTTAIAARLCGAFNSHDLASFGELLDENVQWGPRDYEGSCHNRSQVLAWFARLLGEGVDGTVTEVATSPNHVLLGLDVVWPTDTTDPERPRDRYQLYTVRDGRIVELEGFEDRASAARQAGLAT
jgi:ketosteroid isomerase-like protein